MRIDRYLISIIIFSVFKVNGYILNSYESIFPETRTIGIYTQNGINGKIFNVGSENYKLIKIANTVKEKINGTNIKFVKSVNNECGKILLIKNLKKK